MTTFSIVIADVPEQEGLVAEIWLDGEQWGELSNHGTSASLRLYPPASGGCWELDPDALVEAITRARSQLGF